MNHPMNLNVYLTEGGEDICIRAGETCVAIMKADKDSDAFKYARAIMARVEATDEVLEIAKYLTDRMDSKDIVRLQILGLMERLK